MYASEHMNDGMCARASCVCVCVNLHATSILLSERNNVCDSVSQCSWTLSLGCQE